ncbi:NAD(P)-dependent oxidoreductase [Sagittula sp. NFXS13]|uniref:NAD-dependent epimerase/dehydratase family protein n=1 Tax=Sagittula sp. NFXS13 TaxID=2819095 RepID=UPI0032DE96C1
MIALTGATGLVGRWLLPLADLTFGRRPAGKLHRDYSLTGPPPDMTGVTTLIHAAFQHEPGRYRGGEGDNPEGFIEANLHGTLRLFDAVADAGVERVIFLSSRAVFDGLPPATNLSEDLTTEPKSLYGQVKAAAETRLFSLPMVGISLRATGIYGPGKDHKWTGLFADHLNGRPVAPRRGTEVHGTDLAQAARLALTSATSGAMHVSDILLDRHDLLTEVNRLTGCKIAPPTRATSPVSPLICEKLRSLGWIPGGMNLLRSSLSEMLPDTAART